MLDQAMSSLSNVVVTIMVARVLDPTGFGAFSVAFVAYQVAVGGVRAVVGEPWLSAHSTDEPGEKRRAMSDLVPASLVVSIVCSAVILALAMVNGGAVKPALVALAIVFPYLGVQDALRFVAVVDRPAVAVASDGAWFVVGAALVAVAPSDAAPEWFVVAWGVGGAVGGAIALVLMRVPLQTGRAVRWLTSHRTMSSAYLGEYVSAHASGQLMLLGLGGIAGLAALGAVRAAQVFYGPLNTLFGGIYMALVPDGARQRHRPDALVRMMVAATALITGAAALWMMAGLVMPDRLGTALFGRTWTDAQDLMLPMGLATVAGSAATGGLAGLRSLGAARRSLRARLYSLPPLVLFTLVGAATASAIGYTIGFALANAVVTVVWWVAFLGAVRRLGARHLAGSRSGTAAATAAARLATPEVSDGDDSDGDDADRGPASELSSKVRWSRT
jgi:O-antigen/teichoic acid export membrane protein